MNEEEMKQLLKEMQENCVKGMLKGAIYEDEKAEQKAIAIDLALKLIENQKAEIEKLKSVELKAKGGAVKITLERLLNLQEELEKKDKIIDEMAEDIIDYEKDLKYEEPFSSKDEVIGYYRKGIMPEED